MCVYVLFPFSLTKTSNKPTAEITRLLTSFATCYSLCVELFLLLIRGGVYVRSRFLTCDRLFWQQDAAHCFRGEVGLSGIQEMDWDGGKGPGTETNPSRKTAL